MLCLPGLPGDIAGGSGMDWVVSARPVSVSCDPGGVSAPVFGMLSFWLGTSLKSGPASLLFLLADGSACVVPGAEDATASSGDRVGLATSDFEVAPVEALPDFAAAAWLPSLEIAIRFEF